MTVRNMKRDQAVKDEILASSKGKGELVLLEMELDSFESVRKAAKSS
jgi:hypothetical protein